jgi:ABC-type arginine/histidine transport system permease subunit
MTVRSPITAMPSEMRLEVLRRGVMIYSRYFNSVEVLLVVGVVYFLFCAGLSSAVARLERRSGATPTAGAAARRE